MSSRQWRQSGNNYYKLAQESTDLTAKGDFWKESICKYEEAMKKATIDEELYPVLKNLAMANWRLGQNCNNMALQEKSEHKTYYYNSFSPNNTNYNPYVMMHFYKEAIKFFGQCLKLKSTTSRSGGDADSKKYADQLLSNLDACGQEALSYLINMDHFPTYKIRVDQLDHLIKAINGVSNDWSAMFNLEKAKTLHKWAVTEKERSRNYVTALICLKDCYSPLEIIRILTEGNTVRGIFREKILNEYNELKDSVNVDTFTAEAMKLIQKGDEFMKISVKDSEFLDTDGLYEAIFNYREALAVLHDSNGSILSLEAESLGKIGYIYYAILKNETQGHELCLQSIQLAGSIEHQNFVGQDWYDKATAVLKKIQDDLRKKEEEEARKRRELILKNMEPQLIKLREFDEKSAQHMIVELPKMFKPKHRSETAIKEMTDMKFNGTQTISVRKALSKLILLYHPDHVKIEEYGEEYFVLCEEIAKTVTRKYEFFK